MQILILGDSRSYYCVELQNTALNRGHHCVIQTMSELSATLLDDQFQLHQNADHKAQPWDICLPRGMSPGSLEQVILRMDLLWGMEVSGVQIVNSAKAMECAIDKFLTLIRCQRAGLPFPETACCQRADEALKWFDRFGKDVVVKPIFGAEGRGMIRLTDVETAGRVFRSLEQIQAAIYVQRYLKNAQADLRIMVIDGEPLGAIRRQPTTDFRSNAAQLGQATLHKLSDEESALATTACQATGVVFGGVDLMRDTRGNLQLIEVNACPGWRLFQQVTNIDVAKELFDWLEAKR